MPHYVGTRRALLGGGALRVASWTVTTTGAATHTIAALTVSASTVVDWGDGSSNAYTGSGARTHNYASAGTWTVRVLSPLNVTALTLSDNKITLNSRDIASMTAMVTFQISGLKAGTFNSADISAWRPTTFLLYSMPAGYAGTFNSADVSAWRPTAFYLYSMPAGYAGTFNSADVSAWRPTDFRLYSMPAATYAFTVGASDFASWTTTNNFQMQSNALSAAQVDTILWSLYQASIAPRTATGGTINVGGSNAAPTGTYQACASPPVSAATPGKEIAHELVNDTIGAFANHWATVTTS